LNERRLLQATRVLDDDEGTAPCSRDRVIEKASLALDGPRDLVGPEDDDRVEFTILRLMDRHGPHAALSHPAMRPGTLVVSSRLEADLFGRERCPSSDTLLPIEPIT